MSSSTAWWTRCRRAHRSSGAGAPIVIPLPAGAELPAFLTLDGVADSPEGDLVLVLRRKPGLRDLIRRRAPFQATVTVAEVYFSPDSADSSNR